jgi:DNA-binding NarL/FixJ family response regulator
MTRIHCRITEFRPFKPLTARELEFLPLLAEFTNYDDIGTAAGCSPRTAELHVTRIADKLPGCSAPLLRAARYAVIIAVEAVHAEERGRAA